MTTPKSTPAHPLAHPPAHPPASGRTWQAALASFLVVCGAGAHASTSTPATPSPATPTTATAVAPTASAPARSAPQPVTAADVLAADWPRAERDPLFAPFAAAWKRATQDIRDPAVSAYMATYSMDSHWVDQGERKLVVMPETRALAGCVTAARPELQPSAARFAFEIDARGIVRRSTSDLIAVYAAMDSCLTSTVTGIRLPPPPRAFVYCAAFKRVSARELAVEFCNESAPAAAPVTAPAKAQAAASATR